MGAARAYASRGSHDSALLRAGGFFAEHPFGVVDASRAKLGEPGRAGFSDRRCGNRKAVQAHFRIYGFTDYRAGVGRSAAGAASLMSAETPTTSPPMRQKICRQISEGTASRVMPWIRA